MTERIDHAAEALRLRQLDKEPQAPESSQALLASAQVHATLALVEQQRIANLIALGAGTPESSRALFVEAPEPWDFDKDRSLKPDIAAALGLTAGQEGESA